MDFGSTVALVGSILALICSILTIVTFRKKTGEDYEAQIKAKVLREAALMALEQKVGALDQKVDARFDELGERIDELQSTLLAYSEDFKRLKWEHDIRTCEKQK